ncbi:DEAD/DEAH box helicase [Rosistilla oblonga]|uniref:preprotein translocase subunit SecA n=1 Tax=Rosistilla oblonga TaxID=2527990 RepID=UPI003A97C526
MFSLPIRPTTSRQLARIDRQLRTLSGASDRQLRERSASLRYRAAAGESLHRLLPEAYALVVEAADRTLGIRHYDVQLLGGIHLANRCVIEMETGQGKTLTATLPLFLHALRGQGVHLATSNDYLAQRDADTMRPLFSMLGLTCGVVVDGMDDSQRRQSYRCDITYATAAELGFDFLRDRLKRRAAAGASTADQSELQPVGRELDFLLADEADALMIDEANTPMIIGAPSRISDQKQALYQWAAQTAPHSIEKQHYRYNLRERSVELLPAGRQWARQQLSAGLMDGNSILDLFEKLERAITVDRDFHRDQHYIVRDGEIVLINEATGRLGEGRQWQDGIQQAIQAVERLPITAPTTHAAKLTVQGLFLSYRHLAGMTGTAVAAASELRKVYKTNVVRIPPLHKSRRQALSTRYFADDTEKYQAIVDEIIAIGHAGRPVLIGTRSVENSQRLSRLLRDANVPHQVLNAHQHASEAKIIALAGRAGQVTVATSMAGRGTDIRVEDDVVERGGLHVILTELHDSPRQDQQLWGRCGRQGQPGTYRQFLSLDDAILDQAYGDQAAAGYRTHRRGNQAALLSTAQQTLEQRRRQNRLTALYHEKRRLRAVWEMGRDPLLDVM